MFGNQYLSGVNTLVTFVGVALGCGTSEASLFTYNDFSDVSNLTFVTSATTYENRLRLNGTGNNNSGAVWTKDKHTVAYGFKTTYSFRIGEQTQGPGSDVLEFYVQNYAADAIYYKSFNDPEEGTILEDDFLRIQIDTYQNAWDNNNWHLEVKDFNELTNDDRYNNLGLADLPGTKNSDLHDITVEYTFETTQLVISFDGTQLLDIDYDLAANMTLDNGQAYVGFIASSGAVAETHDVFTWSWESNDANPVPEPAAIAVWSALGLFGVGFGLRRKYRKSA